MAVELILNYCPHSVIEINAYTLHDRLPQIKLLTHINLWGLFFDSSLFPAGEYFDNTHFGPRFDVGYRKNRIEGPPF
jgi:hypothetical protein